MINFHLVRAEFCKGNNDYDSDSGEQNYQFDTRKSACVQNSPDIFYHLASVLLQTRRTFSVGSIIRSSLHLEHLTVWSFTRLISSGSKLLIRFFRVSVLLLFGMGFLAVERY